MLGNTKLVGAQQNHTTMGQSIWLMNVHCTPMTKWGVNPISIIWCHTMAPRLGTTNLVNAQQNLTTMEQSIWLMNVHCTFTTEWGVNPMGNWCYMMASKLGTTNLVDVHQDHMVQYSCSTSMHCTCGTVHHNSVYTKHMINQIRMSNPCNRISFQYMMCKTMIPACAECVK